MIKFCINRQLSCIYQHERILIKKLIHRKYKTISTMQFSTEHVLRFKVYKSGPMELGTNDEN